MSILTYADDVDVGDDDSFSCTMLMNENEMKLHYRGFCYESSCVEFAKLSHYRDPEYAMSSQGYSRAVHCDDCCLAAEE
jgi:hypothetical protein